MFSLNIHSYAWHENLGIDNNKAAELYQTKPNDPAILQWKNALQLAINDADNCFDVESAIACQTLISKITSNCGTHPNELLACNDTRFAQFPLILKQAQEAQIEAEEEKKKADEARLESLEKEYSTKFPQYAASLIIDRCVNNSTNASSSCQSEMLSLQKQCQLISSAYDYCKDDQFLGYLKQHNILNSTTSP